MSIEHYENFPVASWLCPPHLRPAVVAIYHFARTADDLADEGQATAAERQAELRAYRQDLRACFAGQPTSPRWAARVFAPLSQQVRPHRLPLPLFEALLDAFEQDLVKTRYASRAELLHYCERSANPVGRLLLHLYGVDSPQALRQSDAICSALQLVNFWQDFSRDGPNGRCYVPLEDLERHGLQAEAWVRCEDSPSARRLIAALCSWARELMLSGAPLVHALPGRAGWELRLVVQGGLRILERIEAMDHASLVHRPRLGALDLAPMLWQALRMRPTQRGAAA